MKTLALALAMLFATSAIGADPRFCGPPARDAGGTIIRSQTVLRAFQREHPKPQDGRKWIMDHVVPLACGGCDAVQNLQWLPEEQWRAKSLWERKVYGGHGISPGCP
jgi:hypothetical protein